MTVHAFDPLEDPRWERFARRHSGASVFHQREWLEALRRTYGYEPIVYTTSPPDEELVNGVVLCRVESWLTGRRLVSLPFADHCEPLVDSPPARMAIGASLGEATVKGWKYVELRLLDDGYWPELEHQQRSSFLSHTLDLRAPIDTIFDRFHKSTIRRKLHRAERVRLACEEGTSARLLDAFYRLMVITRRRHGVPPQPRAWFASLVACFGPSVNIRMAFDGNRPLGALLTIRHGSTLVYKYGCSDVRGHALGTMPWLFWRTIQSAKAAGIDRIDLGRSDLTNPGLIIFKQRLGGVPSTLTYVRQSRGPLRGRAPMWSERTRTALMAVVPDWLLVGAGRLLYRHFG